MGYNHIEKKCGECQRILPVNCFYKSGRSRDGYCKECRRERDRSRLSTNFARKKEKDPLHFRRIKLFRLYGISHEQYMQMYENQNGLCAICGEAEKRILYRNISCMTIDHDHDTGKIRALLCHRCNSSLGHFENIKFAQKALAYLSKHKSKACDFIQLVLKVKPDPIEKDLFYESELS